MSLAVCTVAGNEQEHALMLAKQVSFSYMAAQQDQCNFSELHENIMQLEEFIFSYDQNEEIAETIFEGLTPELVGTLNRAYSFWQTTLEYDFAQILIKGKVSLSDYPLNERFASLVKPELMLLSDVEPKRILFIGSGPLPINAMHFHFQTGIPLDCAVQDSEAVVVARQAVQACGLGNAIRVMDDAESSPDVSGYDLIVIGLLTTSRKTLLNSLRKRCRPGCYILCRTSHGLRRLVYEPTGDWHVRGFHLKKQLVADGMQTISTWLLEAAVSAAADVRLEWVRQIDAEQAKQLLRLMNRTLEEETTIGYPGPIDDETGHALMRQLDADVRSGHRHVLVAYKDGNIVGQLILTPNSSPNHRHIVELTRGTIHPSFRGGGLALRAFREIAKKCDELKREVICLDVRVGTHAAVLWQHFGFKQYGFLTDYSRVGSKTYQGLYLTQTTAELKQRLAELARTARASIASNNN